ncbi:hypothetical protein [Halopelagius fulvigenes]|uniref:Domain of unknown function domain-containing protein n=1 Tax=Halopelagius fulvigenes TaxID=1198324 RepID=A0ABD5TY28_9EURY
MVENQSYLDDPPAAILTTAQREYLTGEREVEGATERMLRGRIRDRLQVSIFDLAVIVNEMSLDDLDEALSEPDGYESNSGTTPPLNARMYSLATLLYLYHREGEVAGEGQSDGWLTALDIEEGIRRALTRMGVSYNDVNVSIDVDRAEDLETLADREDLASLSREQLTQLLTAGLISGDEHAEAWMEKRSREHAEDGGGEDASHPPDDGE